MTKFIRYISLLLIAVTVLSVFASCSPNEGGGAGDGGGGGVTDTPDVLLSANSGKSFEFNIWCSKQDRDMLEKMCNAWAAANPQNTYKFIFGEQEENNTVTAILNDVSAGPDIYSFPSDQITQLYGGGALAQLGGVVETVVRSINEADSIDAASLKIDGEDRLYAYPMTGDNCYFLYYDKRVYTEEDVKSLDTLLSVAVAANKQVHFKLKDDGWYLSSFFFAMDELGYEVSYDQNMTETGVEINYDGDAGLEVMKALKKYIYNGGLLTSTDDSVILNAFSEGTAAAAVTGTWNAKNIEEKLGTENVGVAKLPTAEIGGEQVQLSGYKGYKLMGVNEACEAEKKGEAHRIALWLTNEQNQLTRYNDRGFRPTNVSALKSEKIASDPIMQVVTEQFKYSRNQKGVPSSYWTPMAQLITPIINARAAGRDITEAELKEALRSTCASIRK